MNHAKSDQLHWDDGVTDQGEAQWTAEALGVAWVVTKLGNGAYLLTESDHAGGTEYMPALSRPVKCDSEEDAKARAQELYEKLIHG